jgi:hypothetical protein
VSSTPSGRGASAEFTAALDSIERAVIRPDLALSPITAPGQLAPESYALAADVNPAHHGVDSELGTGRFVLLHDPAGSEEWGGRFRVVCFAQAPLETDIGLDPFLADVTWSWLIDALESRNAGYHSASGTATKIISTGFGQLAKQGDGAQIELRASWSPTDAELGAHVQAWGDLVCMLAGIPPTAEGVSVLSLRRPKTKRA